MSRQVAQAGPRITSAQAKLATIAINACTGFFSDNDTNSSTDESTSPVPAGKQRPHRKPARRTMASEITPPATLLKAPNSSGNPAHRPSAEIETPRALSKYVGSHVR